MPSTSDRGLLVATAAGEAEAFGLFFERHVEAVRLYLGSRVGRRDEVDDLVAETFAAALVAVHRGKARHVREGLPWLIGIARHKAVDSYRAGVIQTRLARELQLVSDSDERASRTVGDVGDLTPAINELAKEDRAMLVERILLERPYDEIGAAYGLGPTAVRQRLSRALVRVRSTLEVRA